MAPHVPGVMCTFGPYLLYEDLTKKPREIHRLALRDGQPKQAKEERAIHTQQNLICNMYVAQNVRGDEHLLVVGGDKILTYNTKTGQKLGGKTSFFDVVSSDGFNGMIALNFSKEPFQMYSVPDRSLIYCSKKAGSTFLTRWCKKSSSHFYITEGEGYENETLQVLKFLYK